jgi:hypothetical protein
MQENHIIINAKKVNFHVDAQWWSTKAMWTAHDMCIWIWVQAMNPGAANKFDLTGAEQSFSIY